MFTLMNHPLTQVVFGKLFKMQSKRKLKLKHHYVKFYYSILFKGTIRQLLIFNLRIKISNKGECFFLEIRYEHTFNASRETVWDYLQNEEILAKTLPGCKKFEKIEEGI